MTVAAPKIAVFDSGVGGLSTLNALRRGLPSCKFIYCFDDAYYPYGALSDSVITDRVRWVIDALIQREHPDVLVVACNTASTIALPILRNFCTIPVVGVVPGIKPAAALSTSGVIGLLATKATVNRPYIDQLINDFAANCRVIRVGSQALVALAESKIRAGHESADASAIRHEVKPMSDDAELDTVVIGCTHFSHVLDELRTSFDRPVTFVEPNDGVVRRVRTLFPGISPPDGLAPKQVTAFHTKDDAILTSLNRFYWLEHFGINHLVIL